MVLSRGGAYRGRNHHSAPISDPGSLPLLLRDNIVSMGIFSPQSQPTIHVLEGAKADGRPIILVGRERRWVYLWQGETLTSIARKLVMQKRIFWQ